MFERERERERKGEREEERKGLNCSPAKSNLSFLDTGYNQILSDSVLIHLGLKSNLSHFFSASSGSFLRFAQNSSVSAVYEIRKSLGS